jgi:hypothetical protein
LIGAADLVAAAIGKPGFIKGEMLKPGAVVLDFGAAMVDGQMTGDVQYESALKRVSAITPVPRRHRTCDKRRAPQEHYQGDKTVYEVDDGRWTMDDGVKRET